MNRKSSNASVLYVIKLRKPHLPLSDKMNLAHILGTSTKMLTLYPSNRIDYTASSFVHVDVIFITLQTILPTLLSYLDSNNKKTLTLSVPYTILHLSYQSTIIKCLQSSPTSRSPPTRTSTRCSHESSAAK